MSWCLHVPVKEYRTAAVRPPRSLPKKVKFRCRSRSRVEGDKRTEDIEPRSYFPATSVDQTNGTRGLGWRSEGRKPTGPAEHNRLPTGKLTPESCNRIAAGSSSSWKRQPGRTTKCSILIQSIDATGRTCCGSHCICAATRPRPRIWQLRRSSEP